MQRSRRKPGMLARFFGVKPEPVQLEYQLPEQPENAPVLSDNKASAAPEAPMTPLEQLAAAPVEEQQSLLEEIVPFAAPKKADHPVTEEEARRLLRRLEEQKKAMQKASQMPAGPSRTQTGTTFLPGDGDFHQVTRAAAKKELRRQFRCAALCEDDSAMKRISEQLSLLESTAVTPLMNSKNAVRFVADKPRITVPFHALRVLPAGITLPEGFLSEKKDSEQYKADSEMLFRRSSSAYDEFPMIHAMYPGSCRLGLLHRADAMEIVAALCPAYEEAAEEKENLKLYPLPDGRKLALVKVQLFWHVGMV